MEPGLNPDVPYAEDLKVREAMVDLETLATTPDAHILSVGMVAMHDYDITFSCNIKMENQCRKIDEGTLDWWDEQSQEAQDMAFDQTNAIDLPHMLQNMRDWFAENHIKRIWSHGSTFDVAILDNAFRQHLITTPWRFWDVRDTRTLIDMVQRATGSQHQPVREGTYHNALDDAIHQAKWINNLISFFDQEKAA